MNFFQETNPNEAELKIHQALKEVNDPEIAVNIIDLGLIYNIHCDTEKGITITMTLSTPGCPMGDTILSDVERAVQNLFPDIPVSVQLAWEPRWTPDFISPEGKKMLGMN